MSTRIIVDIYYRQYSEVDVLCAEQILHSMTLKPGEMTAFDLEEIPYTKVYTFDFPLEEGEIDIREYAFTLMNGMNPDHQPPQELRSMMAGDYVIIKIQTECYGAWSMDLCIPIGWDTIARGNTPYPGDLS